MSKSVSIGFAALVATAVPAMAQTSAVRFDGSYTVLTATNCLKVRVGDTGTFRFTPDGPSVGNPTPPNNTSLAFFTPFGAHSYFKFGTFDVGVTYILATPLPQAAVIPSLSGLNRYDSSLLITNRSALTPQAVTLIMTGQITDFGDSEPLGGGTCDVTFSAAAVRRFND